MCISGSLTPAGRVYLFNVEDGILDQAIRGQMELYGPVMFVRKHLSVPMCREIYFQDVRMASQAYQALYGGQRGVPTISEVGIPIFDNFDIYYICRSMPLAVGNSPHQISPCCHVVM